MDRNGTPPKKPQLPKPAEASVPPPAVRLTAHRAGNTAPTAPRHNSGRKR